MKIKYASILILSGLAFIVSCCEDDYYGIQHIEVDYGTIPFDRIRLETSSKVRIIQSNEFQVVVSGKENEVYNTHVQVTDDQLSIDEHGYIDPDQVIKIYVPEISELVCYGSSEVYGESEFRQNGNMDLRVSGSGDLDMYIEADHIDVEVSGSGYVFLEGAADNFNADLSGSGWLRSFGLHTDFSDVRIDGSGSAEVTVASDLDVLIYGSGDVYYKGHPQINATVTGSGELIDAN